MGVVGVAPADFSAVYYDTTFQDPKTTVSNGPPLGCRYSIGLRVTAVRLVSQAVDVKSTFTRPALRPSP